MNECHACGLVEDMERLGILEVGLSRCVKHGRSAAARRADPFPQSEPQLMVGDKASLSLADRLLRTGAGTLLREAGQVLSDLFSRTALPPAEDPRWDDPAGPGEDGTNDGVLDVTEREPPQWYEVAAVGERGAAVQQQGDTMINANRIAAIAAQQRIALGMSTPWGTVWAIDYEKQEATVHIGAYIHQVTLGAIHRWLDTTEHVGKATPAQFKVGDRVEWTLSDGRHEFGEIRSIDDDVFTTDAGHRVHSSMWDIVKHVGKADESEDE